MAKKRRRLPVGLRIAIPLMISALVVGILLSQNFHPEAFRAFSFTWRSLWGVLLAILAFLVQNFAMAWRYRLLASKEISLKGGLRVQQLMEFTSAATPSSVGGSGILFLFLSTEGVRAGKATAITFSALFLDELFLFLTSFFVILFSASNNPFADLPILSSGLYVTFNVVTAIVGIWALLLFVALFLKPEALTFVVRFCSRLFFLRKYKRKILGLSEELLSASKQISNRSLFFWGKLFLLTVLTWGARFAIAVCLIYGFSSVDVNFLLPEHNLFTAYLEQIVIWMLSMVMPTPGGSGFAEYMFQGYYGGFFVSMPVALVVAVIWRCLNAYIYFLTGGWLLSLRLSRMKLKAKGEELEDASPESVVVEQGNGLETEDVS